MICILRDYPKSWPGEINAYCDDNLGDCFDFDGVSYMLISNDKQDNLVMFDRPLEAPLPKQSRADGRKGREFFVHD